MPSPVRNPNELYAAAEQALFRSPIPVQSVASYEFAPTAQTARQREFEARVKALGTTLAKRHGMSRRAFFRTSAGMAAVMAAAARDSRSFGASVSSARAGLLSAPPTSMPRIRPSVRVAPMACSLSWPALRG